MTDEQRIQEQFEAHFHSLGHSELLTRHPDGFYSTASVRNEWRGFQDGYRSRDAEVQALREALAEVTEDLASEVIAKYGPIQAHPDTVRRFDRDMDTVYRARKLLAGGEGGEPE